MGFWFYNSSCSSFTRWQKGVPLRISPSKTKRKFKRRRKAKSNFSVWTYRNCTFRKIQRYLYKNRTLNHPIKPIRKCRLNRIKWKIWSRLFKSKRRGNHRTGLFFVRQRQIRWSSKNFIRIFRTNWIILI